MTASCLLFSDEFCSSFLTSINSFELSFDSILNILQNNFLIKFTLSLPGLYTNLVTSGFNKTLSNLTEYLIVTLVHCVNTTTNKKKCEN